MTRIKICGLSRERDVDYVNQYLPDYAGFLIRYTKNHRSVTLEEAEGLIRLLNPGIQAVGVVANQPLEGAAQLLSRGIVEILQLRGEEDDDYVKALKALTGRPVWKSFSIRSSGDFSAAAASSADAVVLEIPADSVLALDPAALQALPMPWFLSGGVTAGNVVKVLKQYNPQGVDLSSGVESDGRNDKGKISSVIASVRRFKKG